LAVRGIISRNPIGQLEAHGFGYILGIRMCRVSVVKKELLTRAGRYKEVTPEIKRSHVSSPQKVKQVLHEGKKYVICFNTKQAGKDAADRR